MQSYQLRRKSKSESFDSKESPKTPTSKKSVTESPKTPTSKKPVTESPKTHTDKRSVTELTVPDIKNSPKSEVNKLKSADLLVNWLKKSSDDKSSTIDSKLETRQSTRLRIKSDESSDSKAHV